MIPAARRRAVDVNSPTEQRNPRTLEIDRLPTLDVLRLINDEDRAVADAVGAALPDLARAVDIAVDVLRGGGRVHYAGAGTSGRLAVLDAAELVPTYNVPPDWFLAHHAGGPAALLRAVENVEDDDTAGAAAIERHASGADFVVGVAASGRTPFVLGALAAARRMGARSAMIAGNPGVSRQVDVDVMVVLDTGPEAIAGSTRMKAGTAQKMALTAFSTAVMVRMGRTYSNLMVSLVATNAKLRGRMVRILREATGLGERECATALAEANGDVKTALVRLLSGVDVQRAAAALAKADGHVREALARLAAGDD
ncbi:N-acetylmuramic acid 6-phosphate etherase [Streptoalloteichus tenebrarius]|uniref:N-acetylmuramic acid 6-phosphate etherase n=1 Tax=Streptoalloteichus tenebrarius (strain ATCC 17920 / DSM 40477 / JCM 4838 / CBS 697.72 / NBRC 16177 / NCIMB 11028 / NRRL B-12390 / A12253. 1 / ISP 5477) TaxID=1933 RepID=A0ABT1HR72_STRSD|nr:N-acetylmuramic acid 6-phosphate etherase [Streptoalloteichus tenebrarius]MCP2257992.1 N-acetylmuramic acid 6-phosphate etherase [Streptoalloteichus tenebrarius]BFF01659.1 N-acetylmuramic acid 6-phosphate etherase [Streptoalloteichus tenebrarius]